MFYVGTSRENPTDTREHDEVQIISLAVDNVQLSVSYADEALQNSSSADSAQVIKMCKKCLLAAVAGKAINKILSDH